MQESTPRDLCRQNEHSIIKLVTIKHVKRRQLLNEDTFEASVLRFFIVS